MNIEQKAAAVLRQIGKPRGTVNLFSAGELAKLAAVYDRCLAPAAELPSLVDLIVAERDERLAQQKATVDDCPRPKRK